IPAFFLLTLGKIEINFTRTEQHFFQLRRIFYKWIVYQLFESAGCKFPDVRIAPLMPQVCLGREIYQWLSERPCQLTSQQVKEICRSGNVSDHHIQLCAHL